MKDNFSPIISFRRYDGKETININVTPIAEAVFPADERIFIIDSGYMFLMGGIDDFYTKDNCVVSLKTINNIQSYYAKPKLTKDGVLTEAGKLKALQAGDFLKTICDRGIQVVRITNEQATSVVKNPPEGRKLSMAKNEDNLISVGSWIKFETHHEVKFLTNSPTVAMLSIEQAAFAHNLERRGPNRKK